MANPKIAEEGEKYQFTSDKQPIGVGRKPGKLISTILKELMDRETNLSEEEIKEYGEYAANKKLTNSEVIALKLLVGIRKGSLSNQQIKSIVEVLDRVEGKAIQKVESKTEIINPDIAVSFDGDEVKFNRTEKSISHNEIPPEPTI